MSELSQASSGLSQSAAAQPGTRENILVVTNKSNNSEMMSSSIPNSTGTSAPTGVATPISVIAAQSAAAVQNPNGNSSIIQVQGPVGHGGPSVAVNAQPNIAALANSVNSSLTSLKMSKVILNSLVAQHQQQEANANARQSPNSMMLSGGGVGGRGGGSPSTSISSIIPGISQSSSRSSLCTPRSSTSFLSSQDIDLLMEQHQHPSAHLHHPQHHQHQQHQGQHHLVPPGMNGQGVNMPMIGTPGTFLGDARHSMHLPPSSSHNIPNFNSNDPLDTFLAQQVVKMRHKSSSMLPNKSNPPKVMTNSDSGISSMLPSSSSSSLIVSAATASNNSAYLLHSGTLPLPSQQQQNQPSPVHSLHHSYSSSSVPSSAIVIRNLPQYSALGMPSSTSSLSSNSSMLLHGTGAGGGGHHASASMGGSTVANQLLLSDYDEFAAAMAANNKSAQSNSAAAMAAAAALANQYRASAGNKVYGLIGDRNDARNDYESLYRKYADLDNFHSEVVNKLSMAVAENQTQRKKYEDLIKTNKQLEQQCQMTLRQWEKAMREVAQLKSQLDQVKKQRDDANKECNDAMAGRSKAIKDKQRMYEERNTALREYSMIMGERDSVHKEIDRLNDDLNEVHKKNANVEKERKATLEELESLRRELASALLDRDRVNKLCNDMKQKYGELQQQSSIYGTLDGNSHYSSAHSSSHYYSEANGGASSSNSNSSLMGMMLHHQQHHQAQSPTHLMEQPSASSSSHHWSPLKSFGLASLKNNPFSAGSSTSSVSTHFGHKLVEVQHQQPTEQDGTTAAGGSGSNLVNNDQMDALRKQFDRLQLELQEAYQEIEVCKKRRDWAFSERDKIVLERESIRTLCDKLRRERDRKVSDLAEALRESDEVKRQKNEALKEVKELKEKVDSGKSNSSADKETTTQGGSQGSSSKGSSSANSSATQPTTCTSQDSAIDLDESSSTSTAAQSLPCNVHTPTGSHSDHAFDLFEVLLKRDAAMQTQSDWGFRVKIDETNFTQPMVVIGQVSQAALSQLKVSDQLVRINDIQLSSLLTPDQKSSSSSSSSRPSPKQYFHTKVQSLISDDSATELKLQIRRCRTVMTTQTVTLPKCGQINSSNINEYLSSSQSLFHLFGFDADCVLLINQVDSSPSQSGGNVIHQGDRITSLNGATLNNLVGSRLVQIMLQQQQQSSSGLRAQVARFVPNLVSNNKTQKFSQSHSQSQPQQSQPSNRLSVMVDPTIKVQQQQQSANQMVSHQHSPCSSIYSESSGTTIKSTLCPSVKSSNSNSSPQKYHHGYTKQSEVPVTVQSSSSPASRKSSFNSNNRPKPIVITTTCPIESQEVLDPAHSSLITSQIGPTGNFYPIISINGQSLDAHESSPSSQAVGSGLNGRVSSTMVESSSDDDDDDDGPTFVVDEDNDADADDDDSTTTADSDTATDDGDDAAAEDKTIAVLDKVLEKYQMTDNDFYGSTVTNSSGSSMLVPLVPTATALLQPSIIPSSLVSQQSSIYHEPIMIALQQQPQQQPPPPQQSIVATVVPTQQLQQPQPPPPTNIVPPLQVSQGGPSGATVVRRSSRLSSKKARSQRCTLAAEQLTEAAHELSLALAAASHATHAPNSSSGDTWPRYRPPHQLLSSILPSFYKHHGNELQQIYSKQGQNVQQQQQLQQQQQQQQQQINASQTQRQHQRINYDELSYLTTIHHPRRKQRKSLGMFTDIFPTADGLVPRNSEQSHVNASGVVITSSSSSTVDTTMTTVSASSSVGATPTRRSPRMMGSEALDRSNRSGDYGIVSGISYDHHQMSYHSHNNHHLGHPSHQAPPPPPAPISHRVVQGGQSIPLASLQQHQQQSQPQPQSQTQQQTQSNLQMQQQQQQQQRQSIYGTISGVPQQQGQQYPSNQQQQHVIDSSSSSGDHQKIVSGVQSLTLSRAGNNNSNTYNSVKSKQSSTSGVTPATAPQNYYPTPAYTGGALPQQQQTSQSSSNQSSDSLVPPGYYAQQSQSQQTQQSNQPTQPSSYSPIYSSFSTYSRGPLKSIGGLGDQLKQQSQQSSGSQQQQPTNQSDAMFLYGVISGGPGQNNNNNNNNVDYSVVSAQSQDKNVLKYYKTRQASGTSQTGVSPSPVVPQQIMQQQQQAPPYSATPSAMVSISGGAVSAVAKVQPQQQTSTRSQQSSSVPAYPDPTVPAHLYSYSNDIYGQTRMKTSELYATIGRTARSSGSYYANPSALLSAANVGSNGNGLPSHHLLGADAYGTVSRGASSVQLPAGSNRHSMNLALLGIGNSGSGSGTSSAGSLMLPPLSSHHRELLASSGPPLYEHHHFADIYGPPGSSKTLPNQKHSNNLLSISNHARQSYKDSFNQIQSPSVYSTSSAYDSSHLSSRTSITSSLASGSGIGPHHPQSHHLSHSSYPPPDSIYGSLLNKATTGNTSGSSSQRATPPPPAPPTTYNSSTDEALNLIGPSAVQRIQRFRIPSNSSTVSASRASSKGGVAYAGLGLGLDKSLSNQSGLPLSTSGIYGSSNNGSGICLPSNICGDRSSLVSSTGSGIPLDVKWIKCTKDGSPGSPILDERKANKKYDYRLISIERSSALIGIRILRTTKSRGVFVQMVTEGSLAAQAGIQVGDQIIDICGINMRTADFENAAKVLNQCGDPIQMLVQHNYDKFKEIWQSMTITERCNSLDSMGLSAQNAVNAVPSGSGSVSGSVGVGGSSRSSSGGGGQVDSSISSTRRRESSNDSILGDDTDADRDEIDDLCGSIKSSGGGSGGGPDHRYSIISDQSTTSTNGTSVGGGGGGSGRRIRRVSSKRSGSDHDPTTGLVIHHSRHSTLTNDDISSTSAASTLTRRPKVASLPHECAMLISGHSPTQSTSNEDQSSHSIATTSASSSQASNIQQAAFHSTAQFASSSSSTTNNSHEQSNSSPCNSNSLYHQTHSSSSSSKQLPISARHSQSPPNTNTNSSIQSSSGLSEDPESGRSECEENRELRRIVIQKSISSLGLSLIGGNAVGIFIHSIRDEQLAESGLEVGDQIVEYNGTDLRHATAEEAAIELAKPAEVVQIVVHHNMQRFHEIQQTNLGDSFYIKCAFDRPSIDGSLHFHKNQVLYVDNTMYKGVPGVWSAWSVNSAGGKDKFGIIPSRYKAEEELMTKRGGVYCSEGSGSGSIGGTTRRSFFRRRKNGSGGSGSGGSGGGPFATIAGIAHFRSSSRDSTTKEIACYSDISSLKGLGGIAGDATDPNADPSEQISPEYVLPVTYIHVDKLSYDSPRPVIIIGPMKEVFIEKLEQDFPKVFQRCLPEVILRQHNDDPTAAAMNQQLLDSWMAEKKLVDYRRRGSYLECTTISSIKKISDDNLHALLDVNPHSVQRLAACRIYPVVVFLKFKSTRQIKEINRCPNEKLSSKAAKEMYEHSLKIESEFKELITVTIPGSNLSYMCTQVKMCIDQEQEKALWL